MSGQRARGACVAAALMFGLGCATAQVVPAEYAVRWNSKEGGPDSPAAVAKLLGFDVKDKGQVDVRYFDVKAPADAPSGAASILRERVEGGKVEVTWKYRGNDDLALSGGAAWKCPLRNESKRKDEMDISVLSTGDVRRSFSRSCTSKGSLAAVVPDSLSPKQKGCTSTVVRREAKHADYKIEEWRLLNGQKFVELSWGTADSPANLDSFRKHVAALIAKGAKPVDRSKTEIGTQCQGQ